MKYFIYLILFASFLLVEFDKSLSQKMMFHSAYLLTFHDTSITSIRLRSLNFGCGNFFVVSFGVALRKAVYLLVTIISIPCLKFTMKACFYGLFTWFTFSNNFPLWLQFIYCPCRFGIVHGAPSFSGIVHGIPSFSGIVHDAPSFSGIVHGGPSFRGNVHGAPSFSR